MYTFVATNVLNLNENIVLLNGCVVWNMFLRVYFMKLFAFLNLQHGMSAYFYQKHIMDEANFAVCQNYVLSLALQIFPDGERFKDSFREAYLVSDLSVISALVI